MTFADGARRLIVQSVGDEEIDVAKMPDPHRAARPILPWSATSRTHRALLMMVRDI